MTTLHGTLRRRPETPETIRERLHDYASRPTPTNVIRGVRGAIIGAINKQLYDPNDRDMADWRRRLVLGWLFTPDDEPLMAISSGMLTPQQWSGLYHWISFVKIQAVGNEGIPREKWDSSPAFKEEVGLVYVRAEIDMRRQEQLILEGKPPLTMAENIELAKQATWVDIEPQGMVQAAVLNLGGVITDAGDAIDAPPFHPYESQPAPMGRRSRFRQQQQQQQQATNG